MGSTSLLLSSLSFGKHLLRAHIAARHNFCRSSWIVPAVTAIIVALLVPSAQSQTGFPTLEGTPPERIVNPLPVPIAVLVVHTRNDNVIDSKSVVVVEAKSSQAIAAAPGSTIKNFEVLAPIALKRAPGCGASAQSVHLTQEEINQDIRELDTVTLDSPEAQAVVAAAVEKAHLEMEQRFDEAHVRRTDAVAAELRAEQFRDADLATKQKMIEDDRHEKIYEGIEDVMFISAAYEEKALEKERQAAREAGLLAKLLESKADYLKRLDSDYAVMAAEADAARQLQTVSNTELEKRFTSRTIVKVPPSLRVARRCSAASNGPDQVGFEWDAPADFRTLLGNAIFDRGGEEPVIFHRILGSPQWIANFYWPLDAHQAAFRLPQPGSRWISLSGNIDPGRRAASQQVKEAKKAVTALRRRYHDARFSADGGDDTRTAILP